MSLTSVLTKRRPGRPRKNPEATETQEPAMQTAPVADTAETPADTATAVAPVKRRGRPKGSKNKPKVTEPAAETAPVKRRGRPKGSKNKPKVTEPAAETAPVKRGPGRPRKNPEVTGTAPAVKRGPGRPRKDATATGTAAPAVKRGPGRPKGSKNKPKTTEATAAPTVKRGPGRPRKNPEAVTPTVTPTVTAAPVKTAAGGISRKALQNPFKAGESIQVPSGSVFTSSAPTAKGRQVVRRGHNVTVHDIIPARVQPRKSEKGSNVLVRPPRIRAKGSGGYWKDITLTEKIVRLNGKTPSYEEVSFNPQEEMAN